MRYCHEVDLPFRIKGFYSAWDHRWDKDMVFKGESHDFWELVVVVSGQVEAVEEDRPYIMEGGMMICHAPGEFHRIRSAGGTSPRFLVMTFTHDGELPRCLGEGVFSLDGSRMDEYMRIFSAIHRFIEENNAAMRQGEAPERAGSEVSEALYALQRFLMSLAIEGRPDQVLSLSGGAREYRELVRVMNARVRDNITLGELAEHRHISESYIKKLFRTYAGEGPISYYSRLRVKEIKRMLELGAPIGEIADCMGFSSAAYLTAFFKRNTGLCPRDYRLKSYDESK